MKRMKILPINKNCHPHSVFYKKLKFSSRLTILNYIENAYVRTSKLIQLRHDKLCICTICLGVNVFSTKKIRTMNFREIFFKTFIVAEVYFALYLLSKSSAPVSEEIYLIKKIARSVLL